MSPLRRSDAANPVLLPMDKPTTNAALADELERQATIEENTGSCGRLMFTPILLRKAAGALRTAPTIAPDDAREAACEYYVAGVLGLDMGLAQIARAAFFAGCDWQSIATCTDEEIRAALQFLDGEEITRGTIPDLHAGLATCRRIIAALAAEKRESDEREAKLRALCEHADQTVYTTGLVPVDEIRALYPEWEKQ